MLFGRYDEGGTADVQLRTRISGEDRVYRTRFEFPATATLHPEIERLWALALIEDIESEKLAGDQTEEEAADAIRELGVAYQVVTDETAMLVLSDMTPTCCRKKTPRISRACGLRSTSAKTRWGRPGRCSAKSVRSRIRATENTASPIDATPATTAIAPAAARASVRPASLETSIPVSQ